MQPIEDEVQSVEQSPEPTQEKPAAIHQAAETTTSSVDDAHPVDKGTFHDLLEHFENVVEDHLDWIPNEIREILDELKSLVPKKP